MSFSSATASTSGRSGSDWEEMAADIVIWISEGKRPDEIVFEMVESWPDLEEHDFEQLHCTFSRLVYLLQSTHQRHTLQGGAA